MAAKIPTGAYAAVDKNGTFKPWRLERRAIEASDVHISIKFCGICHSDLHFASGHWGPTTYPAVPGHEIVGIVESVGPSVKKYKKGDRVGVGCMVDGCRNCANCKTSDTQYCPKMMQTYGSLDKEGKVTYGGYSRDVVVPEDFVFRVPDNLDLAAAAPLLCAGVTTYSPMVRHGLDKGGKKVGVIGLGGLGHMAVQFGIAFGNEVTVISTSERKRAEAEKMFGVKNFIVSTDAKQMEENARTLDCIVDTAAVDKDMQPYMKLLRTNGVMLTVGAPPVGCKIAVEPFTLLVNRLSISGSIIGSLNEHQEMLDFCGKKNITSKIEMIKCEEIEKSWKRVEKGDVKYRFVIDIEGSCPTAEKCA